MLEPKTKIFIAPPAAGSGSARRRDADKYDARVKFSIHWLRSGAGQVDHSIASRSLKSSRRHWAHIRSRSDQRDFRCRATARTIEVSHTPVLQTRGWWEFRSNRWCTGVV